MKTKIILLILIFFSGLSSSIFAQKVDFLNAPVNPIAFKFKKEHFNLQGPISRYENNLFNEDGYLIQSLDSGTTYQYIDGKLVNDSDGIKYKVNSLGYITSIIGYLDITTNYKYNNKGLLIYEGNKYEYETFTYDSNDRLILTSEGGIHKKNFEGSDYGGHYSYVVNKSTLEVSHHWFKAMTPYKSEYKNGNRTFSGISGNHHSRLKLDSYGNVVETTITDQGKDKTYRHKIEYFEDADSDEKFVPITNIVSTEYDEISKIEKSDLYGTWRVKRLFSNIATIENVDHIIDKEEYEPLKKALTNAKFEINANGSISLFIEHYSLQGYLIDVRWSFDETTSTIIIVDKPGGPLQSEGKLLDISVEKINNFMIFKMLDDLFSMYVEKE